MEKNKNGSLDLPKTKQVRVVEELIESSSLTFDFYLMLILSAIVVTLGLLVDSVAVIIGGMLITPLLTPILTISLGVVMADKLLIWRSVKIILKSLGIILGVSALMAFLFPVGDLNGEIAARLVNNMPYFLVAFASGLAATFAWSKKNLSAMLPGVTIAVSILPPLSVMGIGISVLSIDLVRGSLATFLFNLIGIVLGSVIVFSLLNFHKTKKETEQAVKKEIKEKEKEKEKKKKEELKKEIQEAEEEKKIEEKVKKKMKN